jgi:hypothetical protein
MTSKNANSPKLGLEKRYLATLARVIKLSLPKQT